jgi:2-keto-4-pentenoate hydratase/2-oxohepta-3-ene-1,7-dioic acid hydratase in catechol pathway
MKVATVSAAGERCVGQIAKDGTSIALFDWALLEAQDGVLGLIRRNGVMPTFCPGSPFAVARDEIDIGNTPIKCCVNGELRRSSNTGLLIFDIPKIIETLFAGITLQAGDVIATETPGVGIGSDPPKYLEGDDVVRIEIGGIGILESKIVERTT